MQQAKVFNITTRRPAMYLCHQVHLRAWSMVVKADRKYSASLKRSWFAVWKELVEEVGASYWL